ncbi:MAG: ornithine carbamoyltransferase [Candidatus Cloacimonetes bacterium]|nr:ornithine carbamoyltransferase [Candidatus Cloacimonadota bacterium]
MKHFITFRDFSSEEIIDLLDSAYFLQKDFHENKMDLKLKGKNFALIWDAEGFRNRVAFEMGIQIMGGTFVQVPGKLDAKESIEDVSKYLSNWFDCIIARTHPHEHMIRLTRQNRIPVINARTDFNHPCEILGDLLYIRNKRGFLENLKVVFVGEATNLCISWFEAATCLPIQVTQVCPENYEIISRVFKELNSNPAGKLSISNDLIENLKGADVIYTDCWPKHNDEEVRKAFLKYQIRSEHIKRYCPDVIFLPCPPVTRGEEVSSEVMEEYGTHVFEAKENLLHVQNAVMIHLVNH